MYRKMEDARVTEKGHLVFGDLDHLRRPTLKVLAIGLADLRRDRETGTAVWVRERENFGSTLKTRKGGPVLIRSAEKWLVRS